MKKLITIAAGLLLTTSAFATTVTHHNDAKVFSADYATKAEALNAGYDLAEELVTMNEKQLRTALSLLVNNTVRNVAVDQTEIKTEEFAISRGEIQYRAIVDVDYHFDETEND